VYETRFVTQYPTPDVSLVGAHVAHALQASGHAPSTTSVQLQEEDNTAVVTICYLTDTSSESDSIIAAWRGINRRIQVERNHKLDPTKFRKIALAGRENRQLREHLTREIERLCSIGIGSKGILDYLQESEAVIVELKEFVQSMRAPV
jgi:hypothetical protein